jgi:uncharacterized protein
MFSILTTVVLFGTYLRAAKVQIRNVARMQTYLKTRSVWSQSFIFISLVAAGLLIFVAMLGTWLATKVTGLSLFEISNVANWSNTDPRFVLFLRLMLVMQFLGLFLVPVWVFAYLSDPQPARYLGFRKTQPLFFIVGVLAMIGAIPLVEYLGFLNQKIVFPHSIAGWMKTTEKEAEQQIGMLLQQHTISNLLLNVVLVAGFAAIGEELFFRGVLQRLFIWGFKNVWVGIIVAAFLFSALHLQFYGFFPRFILGILLGAIYWYSGSIWTSIAAHFVYDATLIVMAYFNPSMISEDQTSFIPSSAMVMSAVVSFSATAGLLLYLRRKSITNNAKFQQERALPDSTPFTFD